jgi:glycosyltransferase involved in cell wall biosynthesis
MRRSIAFGDLKEIFVRICMMNDHFYRSSGAAIAIRRISQALADIDYCVAGCVNDGRPEDLSWVPDERFERFDLKSRNPIRVAKELHRFRKWLKLQHCDLVHCHHRRISVLLRLARIPVLYTGQLAFQYSAWFRWLHPRRMTAITPSVASNILETTGQKVIACISNPAQFPRHPPQIDIEKVRHRAVCVARLEPIKGHTYLLDAWKLLLDRGCSYELLLVGEGSMRPQLEAQILRDGLQELIQFGGFMTDISSILSNALFAILVSRVEGQGIVTLEAAAMGRASLLTAVPGSIDLLPPGRRLRNGVEYGNVKALADALEEWFQHPEDVIEEGKRFFNFLKKSSDPSEIASEYKEVYRQILSGRA